jgi:hypothetical protein
MSQKGINISEKMCQYTVLFIFLYQLPYEIDRTNFFLADEADGALPEELEANRSREDGADLGEEQEQQFHHLEETAEPLPESSQPPRQPRSSAYSGTHVSLPVRFSSVSHLLFRPVLPYTDP